MKTLLNPTNDWMFKQLFGEEDRKHLTIHFINTMLKPFLKEPVEDVDFSPTYVPVPSVETRVGTVDVLCKTASNHFLVEMQKASDTNYLKRLADYLCRIYVRQRPKDEKKKGDKGGYGDMKPVMSLAVMGENLFADDDDFLSHYRTVNLKTHKDDGVSPFRYAFLEIQKFHKTFDELETDEEKWAYFFKNAEDMPLNELSKVLDEDSIFSSAYKALEISSYSLDQLEEYEAVRRALDASQTRISDAKTEGLAEGEAKKAREMALKMLKKGKNWEETMEFTDLSLEEIRALAEKL